MPRCDGIDAKTTFLIRLNRRQCKRPHAPTAESPRFSRSPKFIPRLYWSEMNCGPSDRTATMHDLPGYGTTVPAIKAGALGRRRGCNHNNEALRLGRAVGRVADVASTIRGHEYPVVSHTPRTTDAGVKYTICPGAGTIELIADLRQNTNIIRKVLARPGRISIRSGNWWNAGQWSELTD